MGDSAGTALWAALGRQDAGAAAAEDTAGRRDTPAAAQRSPAAGSSAGTPAGVAAGARKQRGDKEGLVGVLRGESTMRGGEDLLQQLLLLLQLLQSKGVVPLR